MTQAPLSLLCVEPRFPGRLGPVAAWLVRKRGCRCLFLCAAADGPEHWPAGTGRGLDVVQFPVGGVAREPAVSWTATLERGLCYAYGAWEVLHARRPWPVHLVLGHSAGLGSSLFAPVDLPAAPVVQLFDYYPLPHAHDLAVEDAGLPPDYHFWRRSAGAMSLLELENGVTPWAPTAWQRDLFPPEYRPDFVVLHPGVDTATFAPGRPRPAAVAGRPLPPGARVVSFVARHLDRLRGFDRFARLANRLLAGRPDVVCVAAGERTVPGGLDVRFHGQDYPAHVFREGPPVDPARFWLPGLLPPAALADLLAASDLHVCPSRPYPVARSLLEAMACGRTVLAWDSEPVREVLAHGQTALLVPPDEEAAWQQACAVLDEPEKFRPLGVAAAELVRQRYAQGVTLPRLAELFDRLVQGEGG
jgi:glycosyltransferase involved in cell wall biosynthesis